jgi:diaminopimelate epimerase
LGNDFVVIDARQNDVRLSAAQVARISDRKTGIGCDQLIIMRSAPDGEDVFMQIYNANGSEVSACGNATRCIGALMLQETGKSQVEIRTLADRLLASTAPNGQITVDMGRPRLEWQQIPLSEPFQDTRFIELSVGPQDNPVMDSPAVVNVGNPHAIFFVEDVTAIDLEKVGPFLEHHPLFPEGANISIAQVSPDKKEITLRVWERGAGITKACGTAACAAIVASARRRRTGREALVHLPGGTLSMRWDEGNDRIYMTGGWQLDFEGEIGTDLLGEAA